MNARLDELENGIAAEFDRLRKLVETQRTVAVDLDLGQVEQNAEAAMARAVDEALDRLGHQILKMSPALEQVTRQLRWSTRLWGSLFGLWILLTLVVIGFLFYNHWFLDQYIPKREHIELILDGLEHNKNRP